jgi:DNA polymerase I-like protein with 3'-5' exonuclease and polymerase domains
MRYLAFDCESELIPDRQWTANYPLDSEAPSSPKKKVYTSPYVTPGLVVVSLYDGENALLRSEHDFGLLLHIDDDVHLVGHNLAFDLDVLIKSDSTFELFFTRLAEEGRLHDTMLLDILYGLRVGRYDLPRYWPAAKAWAPLELRTRPLDVLAQEYCGMRLKKDPRVRLGFGQFRGRPLSEMPREFQDYAKQDAVATYRVFDYIYKQLDATDRETMLGEALQVKASLVNKAMDERGLRIDTELAERLARRFMGYKAPLQEQMVRSGLGRLEPAKKTTVRRKIKKTDASLGCHPEWRLRPNGKLMRRLSFAHHDRLEEAVPEFHTNTVAVQRACRNLNLAVKPPMRDDGTLSLSYDFWAQHVPEDHPSLHAWLQYTKLQKVLTTYLQLYSRTPFVFPRWHVLGARSGRQSASAPSVQNVPKHKLGIRALFVPREGMKFIRVDYSAQEMFTLCEAMIGRGIKGRLFEVLASGEDIHKYGASLMLGKPMTEVTKLERQGQKVLNFGVPGGLGPNSLSDYAFNTFGVKWSVDEAKANRTLFLRTFSDIDDYLRSMKKSIHQSLIELTGQGAKAWADQLMVPSSMVLDALRASSNTELQKIANDVEHFLTLRLPGGRVRSRCRFTEGANFMFQGLASDVTKLAAWYAHRAGLRIVLLVHDEIVVESKRGEWAEDCFDLKEVMLQAFREICPNVGKYASVEVSGALDRWGPATDPSGEIIT